MTTSLSSLLVSVTADEIRARILSGLQAAGFPVSSWPPTAQGGIENGFIDLVSGTIADLAAPGIVDGIRSGFLDLAEGLWLDFEAASHYLLERNGATKTVQAITVTCSADAGPYSVSAGDMVVVGAGTIDGANRYVNLDAATIPKGGTVVLRFEGENAGSAYDDVAGTVTTLVTSLPGVSVVNARILTPNPAALMTGGASRGQVAPQQTAPGAPPVADRFRLRIVASGQSTTGTLAQCQVSTDDGKTWSAPFVAAPTVDLGDGCTVAFFDSPVTIPSFVVGDVFFWGNTSILVQGSDAESDERLRSRCRARWLQLGQVGSSGTVEAWAKQAAPEVARVRVLSDTGAAARMLVYVGSSAGRASPDTVVAVQGYITDRLDVGESASVFSVDTREVAVNGSVQAPRLKLADVQTAAEHGWTAYLASVDIGGTVRLSELQQALLDAGALDFSALGITGGAPNLTIGSNEVAVPPDGTTLFSALRWEPV